MRSGDTFRDELAQRRRRSCLGCLIQPALALLGGGALLYLILMLLAPWNFYFGGHFPRGHGTDLLGVPIHLYFYNWTALQVSPDRRPRFDLYGTFGDSELIMEDKGSLSSAFRPDGTLYGPQDHRSRRQENSRVTLREDPSW